MKVGHTDKDMLTRFIDDLDCLSPIYEYDSRLNFLRVLGISTNEPCHSNLIAWLLDPNGNHGLKDAVLKKFIPVEMDYSSFTVRREWFKIDILAISDSEKYLLCIENKMDTGEHTNQLNQYRRILNKYYPDYQKQYLFLSPNGKAASDPENWKSISYSEVLKILENVNTDNCDEDAAVLIRHYIKTLRRDIVGDEELKELCERIYIKHQTALDLIFANKPKSANIYQILMMWAEDKNNKGEIRLDRDHSTKGCIKFTTEAMSGLIPDSSERNSKWNTNNHYFYEIWVKEKAHDFFIQIVLNTFNMSQEQLIVTKRIMDSKKDVQVMKKATENLNPFVSMHQDYYQLSSDEIWVYADDMFEELKEFEKEVAALLA